MTENTAQTITEAMDRVMAQAQELVKDLNPQVFTRMQLQQLVEELWETEETVILLQTIEHDLNNDCTCPDCDAAKTITNTYK